MLRSASRRFQCSIPRTEMPICMVRLMRPPWEIRGRGDGLGSTRYFCLHSFRVRVKIEVAEAAKASEVNRVRAGRGRKRAGADGHIAIRLYLPFRLYLPPLTLGVLKRAQFGELADI